MVAMRHWTCPEAGSAPKAQTGQGRKIARKITRAFGRKQPVRPAAAHERYLFQDFFPVMSKLFPYCKQDILWWRL
jgi:hypothetical protein